jgi:hypothetical protein
MFVDRREQQWQQHHTGRAGRLEPQGPPSLPTCTSQRKPADPVLLARPPASRPRTRPATSKIPGCPGTPSPPAPGPRAPSLHRTPRQGADLGERRPPAPSSLAGNALTIRPPCPPNRRGRSSAPPGWGLPRCCGSRFDSTARSLPWHRPDWAIGQISTSGSVNQQDWSTALGRHHPARMRSNRAGPPILGSIKAGSGERLAR